MWAVQTFALLKLHTLFLCFVDLHLGIILVNDQLDVHFFFLICLFQLYGYN
jgi:hypothetical protein